MSKEEAFATYLDGKMSKHTYTAVRSRLKSVGSKVFPSYHALLEAKKECYPELITVTETSAEVDLMALLQHTINRLCKVQMNVLLQTKNDLDNVNLILKWGCDGSSGFSSYKQRFAQETEKQDDSPIFVISLVPLQLYNVTTKNHKQILWQNPTTSSTRYCRPIKLIMQSEIR